MRRMLLSLIADAAIVAAVALTPQPVGALPSGTLAGVRAAVSGADLSERIAYVCRHRYYTSRRVCWWRPGKP